MGPHGPVCNDNFDAPPIDTTPIDSAFAPWNPPVQLDFGLGTASVDDPAPRADMLEMLINVNDMDIYRTLRATTGDSWGTPTLVAELDTNTNLGGLDLSADGLTLAYTDDGTGNREILLRTRSAAQPTSAFGTARLQTQINSMQAEGTPALSFDTLAIAFNSTRAGVQDLFMATRQSPGLDFDPAFPLDGLNDPLAREDSPCLSADLRTIYFSSSRNTANHRDLYVATRPDPTADFGNIQAISELNTVDLEVDPWVSPDGHTMYFTRSPAAGGAASIWYTTR